MVGFELEDIERVLLLGRRIGDTAWAHATISIIHYELLVLYQGQAELTMDDRPFPAREGDAVLLRRGQRFSAQTHAQNPCRYYIIHFSLKRPPRSIDPDQLGLQLAAGQKGGASPPSGDVYELPQHHFSSVYLPQVFNLGGAAQEIYTLLEKAVRERIACRLGSETMLTLYAQQVFMLLSRTVLQKAGLNILSPGGGPLPRLVEQAVQYIHEHHTTPFSLATLSGAMSVSPQYLIRIFRRHLGTTPIRYANRYRIDRARELLTLTSMPMATIAYSVGFENPYYFSRVFRLLQGCTPSQYRAGTPAGGGQP